MTLRLIPEIFDSIDVISSVCEELGMVDPHMMKVAHVESIVGLERVDVNNAVGCYFFSDDQQQGLRPFVWDNAGEIPSRQALISRIRPLSRMLLYLAFLCEFLRSNFHPLRLPRSTRNWETCLQ